jgi:hypothetical protein
VYAEQVRERLKKQLQRRAKEPGFELKMKETPVPATVKGFDHGSPGTRELHFSFPATRKQIPRPSPTTAHTET